MNMWPFKNKLDHNGRFIGRKYEYCPSFKLKFKNDVTIDELAAIVSKHINTSDAFMSSYIKELPDRYKRHFVKNTKKDFDKLWNPEMEIDCQ